MGDRGSVSHWKEREGGGGVYVHFHSVRLVNLEL